MLKDYYMCDRYVYVFSTMYLFFSLTIISDASDRGRSFISM